jgi:hypothetical protein
LLDIHHPSKPLSLEIAHIHGEAFSIRLESKPKPLFTAIF